MAVGLVASLTTGTAYVALLAPAVAGAGIAYACGRGTDPTWELVESMAVSSRMVLLVRAMTVFSLNAVLGLAASAASHPAAALTFGWLLPMAAVCALALAAATVSGEALVGVAAGLGGWSLAVLGGRAETGSLVAAITASSLVVPYLLSVVVCGAIAFQATRIPRRTS
jgi:hypothetical protein